MTRARSVLLIAAVLCVSFTSAAWAKPFPRFTERNCSRVDFTSAGAPIRAELCRATTDASAGLAVVVLHGCGGFDTFDHRLAATLPADGVSTLYVDYFGPTPPPGTRGFCQVRGAGTTGFRGVDVFTRWQQVVLDAGAALGRTPGIDPHRVGLVGWSLGGGLAVQTARTKPGRFAAVAAFSTGGGRFGSSAPVKLPPTLLLSGGAHDAIPLSDTLALYDAARAAGTHVELFVYPHGSHNWPDRQGTAGIERAARFLRSNL
jgi:dienelactone hydrolase